MTDSTMIERHDEVATTHRAGNGSASPARSGSAPPVWRVTPELDLYESATEFLILLNVPGASPQSVDVQVEGSTLLVRAQQAALPLQPPLQPELAVAAFERRFELPSEVDAASASAKLRDGVLEIQIQKSSSARRLRIAVNAN